MESFRILTELSSVGWVCSFAHTFYQIYGKWLSRSSNFPKIFNFFISQPTSSNPKNNDKNLSTLLFLLLFLLSNLLFVIFVCIPSFLWYFSNCLASGGYMRSRTRSIKTYGESILRSPNSLPTSSSFPTPKISQKAASNVIKSTFHCKFFLCISF